MRAVVFADRLGEELLPVTKKFSVAMLPIAGKELLIYTIEELVAAGIRDLVIIVTAHSDQLGASTLGEGERWGCTIRYVLSRGEEPPSEVWARLKLDDREPLLVLRGDVLRSPVTNEFLEHSQHHPKGFACCGHEDSRGNLLLLQADTPDVSTLLDTLHWRSSGEQSRDAQCNCEIAALNNLEDLAAFHKANLDLVAGRLPGRKVPGHSIALGLHAGRGAKVSPKSLKKGVVYVGDNSRIHPDAEFVSEVVVGRDVLVDRAAILRDCVVLPRTYVGELVEVANAIVSSSHLIRVDTGAIVPISDAFLLGSLGGSEKKRASTSASERLGGMLLLALSLPLWPIAAATAKLSSDGPMLESRLLVGNRRKHEQAGESKKDFTVRNWNTSVPVLRYLPRLLPVIRGDLRLFGVSPLSPDESESRTEEWQMVRDQAQAGLIGPTQLSLPENAPLEERLLCDAFYAREQSLGKDMQYLLQGVKMLFTASAWRPQK